MRLGGQERQRRRDQNRGDGRELLGGCIGLGDERGDGVGRCREDEHPADDGIHVVQPELETGGHAEVASAAPDRPEEIRVGLGVRAQELAVGGHNFGRQQ